LETLRPGKPLRSRRLHRRVVEHATLGNLVSNDWSTPAKPITDETKRLRDAMRPATDAPARSPLHGRVPIASPSVSSVGR
jgi:hypothetical protein